MPTELHCLLVGGKDYWQGAVVKCGMPAMAGSVTEAQSYNKERVGTKVLRAGREGMSSWCVLGHMNVATN